MMNIEELLNKYFEGETSCEEEKQLRQYFLSNELPAELEVYRPLFAYIESEVRQKDAPAQIKKKKPVMKHFTYWLGGVAAALLIILGINGIHQYRQGPGNYVIIDGKKYTDIGIIQEQARIAFGDVSFSQEDIFESLLFE